MTILQLQELSENQDQYDTVARWDTDQEDPPPDPFLKIYPEEMWREQDPQYFIERIDGPYTILTRANQERIPNDPSEE